MLKKIFAYIIYVLSLFAMLYLILFISLLFLPVFIVLLCIAAWRTYQVRKMWDDVLKQAQSQQNIHKHYRKIIDDNVIDVDYEEIKS